MFFRVIKIIGVDSLGVWFIRVCGCFVRKEEWKVWFGCFLLVWMEDVVDLVDGYIYFGGMEYIILC